MIINNDESLQKQANIKHGKSPKSTGATTPYHSTTSHDKREIVLLHEEIDSLRAYIDQQNGLS